MTANRRRNIARAVIFAVLTVLTQIGGLCYLLGLVLQRRGRSVGVVSALLVYVVLTVVVVPPLAALAGRVRLPCATAANAAAPLVSATRLTCALNRGYVRSTTARVLTALGEAMNRQFPGSQVTTLEGSFPFFDGFYRTADGQTAVPRGSPSWFGYFVYERPQVGDGACAGVRSLLRWDLNWLQPASPAWVLDVPRTAWMLNWLKAQPQVARLFVEPHLARRLGVEGGKVRFQGCQAARHDDHIHIEVN